MSSRVPSIAQCLRISAHLKLQNRRYLFQLWSALIRGRKRTTGTCEREEAGALLIAADGSIRSVNAALLRASAIQEDYIDLPGMPSFSEVVKDKALLMLRAGWRRGDTDAARVFAEQFSQTLCLVWWSEGEDL